MGGKGTHRGGNSENFLTRHHDPLAFSGSYSALDIQIMNSSEPKLLNVASKSFSLASSHKGV